MLATASALVALVATPVSAQQEKDRNDPKVRTEYAPTMLVLDGSGSMAGDDPSGGTKMDAAKEPVRSLTGMLPDDARLGLTTYGTETDESPEAKAEGCRDVTVRQGVDRLDRNAVTSAADGIAPSGFTPIGRALRVAADQLPDEEQRAVVLVSEGLDTCAPPDPCEVAEELAEDGVETVVHAVGFGVAPKAADQLNRIAETTGGTYTDAPDAEALKEALPRITSVALRDYEPVGDPVHGADSRSQAPAVEPGQYLDHFGPQEEKYYSVDIPDGGVGYVSATVPLRREDGGLIGVDALEVDVLSPTGARVPAPGNGR